MKTFASGLFVATLLSVAFSTTAPAQVTPLLSYQGRVQVSGADFNGAGQFKFALLRMDEVAGARAQAVAGSVINGFLISINITVSGSGYTTPPQVTITDSTGSGAVAVAQVSGGKVTGVTVQNAGSNYSSSPTITIAEPPAITVATSLWSNDNTSTQGGAPVNALQIPVAAGVFSVHLGDPKIVGMAPLSPTLFTNQPIYMRVWFNDGSNGFQQLAPDTLLPTSGFAMVAATLADGVPVGGTLADGSVTTAKLADAAVTTSKLGDGSVTAAKLGDASVSSAKLADSSVASAKIAASAVTTTKLADASVANAKLANAAVTEAKLANNAVTALKLADGAVTSTKLAGGAVVRSLNGLADQVTLAAGVGIALDQTGATLTISSTGSGGGGDGWGLMGNAGTSPSSNFLGTTDAQPLELRVAGQRALRLEPTAQAGTANLIAGSTANSITGAAGVAITGGADNAVASAADYSVVGGGRSNLVGQSAAHSSILGGRHNSIGSGSSGAAVFGGGENQIGSNAQYALSLGGFNNVVGNNALYAVILGGSNNQANSPNSLAAGRNAQAQNIGSFVWADSNNGNFVSTAANQFSARSTGGVRFVTAIDGAGTPTAGVSLAAGGTAWSVISDRDEKKNFQSVDEREVLERLAAVPIQHWNYRWEPDQAPPHLGPMAQDFKAAFYPGRDQHTITTLEADGVALAAIQGLNRKLEEALAEKDRRLDELERANAALMRRLEGLEQERQLSSQESKD